MSINSAVHQHTLSQTYQWYGAALQHTIKLSGLLYVPPSPHHHILNLCQYSNDVSTIVSIIACNNIVTCSLHLLAAFFFCFLVAFFHRIYMFACFLFLAITSWWTKIYIYWARPGSKTHWLLPMLICQTRLCPSTALCHTIPVIWIKNSTKLSLSRHERTRREWRETSTVDRLDLVCQDCGTESFHRSHSYTRPTHRLLTMITLVLCQDCGTESFHRSHSCTQPTNR